MDAEALLYVNIERPIAVAPSQCMKLRSGKLLGQVSDNEKSVTYHVPGEQHQWELSGHMAKYMFQRQLGHVMGQTHELVLAGADYTASQKLAKKQRKEAAAAQVVVAQAQKKAKKQRKDVRRKSDKKQRIDWDGPYRPGVPIWYNDQPCCYFCSMFASMHGIANATQSRALIERIITFEIIEVNVHSIIQCNYLLQSMHQYC